jgi:integrase/recombinase XerD
MSALAPTLQGFFTERMLTQRRASPNTVASYRDTFRLLLGFAQRRTGKTPSKLDFEDLDAVLIGAFLEHLEVERHNSVRTRNTRLAAVHSLFAYAALRHPEHAALIQRVLAIPAKRTDRRLVSFLTRDEVDALLAAPDRDTWIGRRDHALLLVAVQSGLRVTELTTLTCADVELGTGAHLRCHGKGDAKNGSRRSPPKRAACSMSGSPSVKENRMIRSSPAAGAGHSAETPSPCSSPNTQASPGNVAHH